MIKCLQKNQYHGPPSSDIPGLVEVAGTNALQMGATVSTDKLHSGVVYPGPKGNWVFNAGTIWWAEALSQPLATFPPDMALKCAPSA